MSEVETEDRRVPGEGRRTFLPCRSKVPGPVLLPSSPVPTSDVHTRRGPRVRSEVLLTEGRTSPTGRTVHVSGLSGRTKSTYGTPKRTLISPRTRNIGNWSLTTPSDLRLPALLPSVLFPSSRPVLPPLSFTVSSPSLVLGVRTVGPFRDDNVRSLGVEPCKTYLQSSHSP